MGKAGSNSQPPRLPKFKFTFARRIRQGVICQDRPEIVVCEMFNAQPGGAGTKR